MTTPEALARLACLSTLVALTALACRKNPEFSLQDSEGRRFLLRCDQDLECRLEQQSGPREAASKTEVRIHMPGKVTGVCAVAPGKDLESPSDCRPLVCQSDAQCPPAHGMAHGTCLGRLCIEPSQPSATVDDAVMLCLAGTGLGRKSQLQTERYAMAVNCGSPCKVPAPCWQAD